MKTRPEYAGYVRRTLRPVSVAVGQSTVSAHLKVLAEVRFVLVEQRSTSRYYRVNDECVACFPTPADVVIGRSAPSQPDRVDKTE